MKRLLFLGDAQDVPPVAICDRCFGEIYPYDRVGEVEGLLLHQSCMTRRERAGYPTCPGWEFGLRPI